MPGEPFFRAPLYPYFLSLLFRLGGIGFFVPRFLQAAVTALNPVLLYLLGRELFPKTVAAAAAVALAGYGILLYFDTSFLLESLLLPLLLLSLYLLARASSENRRSGLWLAAGAALGLASITRPNILLFALTLPVWILSLESTRRRARSILFFLLGTALPIAPVFLHNLSAGEPVLISWQGGINFAIGNNPESDGMTAIAPGTEGTWWGGYRDMIRTAEREAGRTLARREVSAYWVRKGLRFVREEPEMAAALFAKKSYLLVNDFEVSNNQGIYFFRRYSKILSVLQRFGFGLLFPLAAAGAVLVRWDRRRILLLLLLAAYSASVVLFFVTARYRVPLVPVLILLASYTLTRGVPSRKGLRDRKNRIAIAVFAGAALLSNSNAYRLDRSEEAQGHYNAGVVILTAGRFEEAAGHFRRALAEKPRYANARYNLGLCLSYMGNLPEARAELVALLTEHPEHAEALRALASVFSRQGERREALRQLDQAIRLRPDYADALLARAALLEEAGLSGEAEKDRRRAAEIEESSASWR
ncbi:MAG: glycosyltransferase family 39 protein [Candidatus Eisenbacteria bacterium]